MFQPFLRFNILANPGVWDRIRRGFQPFLRFNLVSSVELAMT